MRVFGSVARGEDTDTSDIDLLVDLDVGAALKPVMRDEILTEAIAL